MVVGITPGKMQALSHRIDISALMNEDESNRIDISALMNEEESNRINISALMNEDVDLDEGSFLVRYRQHI